MTSIHESHSGSSEAEYEDDAAIPEAQWQSPQQNSADPSTLGGVSASSSAPASKATVPMQKRRRVTRACDECRRKKIKCDGKQPCTHCTVYSYDCTYDQPSNRRRNPAPQYVEALENRLQRAEALLKSVLPDVDLRVPNFSVGAPHRVHPSIKREGHPSQPGQARPWVPLEKTGQGRDGEKESMLESMVANTGSLDLDDEGHWDFHGHSSGRIFLRKMREQFGELVGKDKPNKHEMLFKNYRSMQPLGSPKAPVESSINRNLPITRDLPLKDCARLLCENAINDAGAMLRLVHQPTFYTMFDRVYDTPDEEFGEEERKFVALLYGVIGLGSLFARADQSQLMKNGYENAIDQGYHWFSVSRQMVDLADCRDLVTLQTIVYMILFLQSSARLSTCYSYIGIALRSSIRMGLHRTVSNAFNPVERELRKRMFWIVRKLDIYVGALLGLPQMLSNDDIDQEMPMEVDDEYITTEQILPMPAGKLSIMTAFNAHTRLVEILHKTVRYIYPIKGNEYLRAKGSQSYAVSHSKIREIEQDLQTWMEKLPLPFRPGEEASPEFMRIRHSLRMAYAHIQMFLYRPFLHYASQSSQAKMVDKRSYACAAACVSVSRNIVHLTGEMKRRGLLVGSYWFYMYTTFFAIISLLFYVLENPQSPSAENILKDACEGRDTLGSLAAKSLAADRTSRTLIELFDSITGRLQDIKSTTSQKKRQAPSPLPTAETKTIQSVPVVSKRAFSNSNPIHSSSTPPTQQGIWQQLSAHQEPSTLRHHAVDAMDTQYRGSSQDPYSPSNPSSAGMQSPNSPSSSMPSTATQSSYGVQSIPSQAVPDLSAMMFPSADPWAYPNQPMTTLENGHSIKRENPLDTSVYNNLAPSTTASYENLNPQMFGLMSPLLAQGQQPGFGIQNLSGAEPSANSMVMQGNDVGGWLQPQRAGGMPVVGFDQIFGEDWGGWIIHNDCAHTK